MRFGIGGVLLLLLLVVRGLPRLPVRREIVPVFLLGAVGYAIESSLFFAALERGTAAGTAIVFYCYPALVTLIEFARGVERPARRTLVALVASVIGTIVVVAAGADVSFSAAGVAFTLASASTFAIYMLVAREVGRRTGAVTMACWVSLGVATTQLLRAIVTGTVHVPADRALELLVYGGASAAAFTLSYAALQRIGTARVSVVLTLEAFSAVVLGAVFLDETIRAVQVLGGIAVLIGAAMIGVGQGRDERTVESAP